MSEYEIRHTRDELHAAKSRLEILRRAMCSVRRVVIANGGSEVQFARACGLSLEELHQRIGAYAQEVLQHDGR